MCPRYVPEARRASHDQVVLLFSALVPVLHISKLSLAAGCLRLIESSMSWKLYPSLSLTHPRTFCL